RGMRRRDAHRRILDHDAPLRRSSEARRGDLEYLRIGLAARDVAARDDRAEPRRAREPLQRQRDVLGRPGRSDRETEARLGERVDELDGAIHRRKMLPDQVAVDRLLARVEGLTGLIVERGAPEARDDLPAGLAERGGELLLGDGEPVLAG